MIICKDSYGFEMPWNMEQNKYKVAFSTFGQLYSIKSGLVQFATEKDIIIEIGLQYQIKLREQEF